MRAECERAAACACVRAHLACVRAEGDAEAVQRQHLEGLARLGVLNRQRSLVASAWWQARERGVRQGVGPGTERLSMLACDERDPFKDTPPRRVHENF